MGGELGVVEHAISISRPIDFQPHTLTPRTHPHPPSPTPLGRCKCVTLAIRLRVSTPHPRFMYEKEAPRSWPVPRPLPTPHLASSSSSAQSSPVSSPVQSRRYFWRCSIRLSCAHSSVRTRYCTIQVGVAVTGRAEGEGAALELLWPAPYPAPRKRSNPRSIADAPPAGVKSVRCTCSSTYAIHFVSTWGVDDAPRNNPIGYVRCRLGHRFHCRINAGRLVRLFY